MNKSFSIFIKGLIILKAILYLLFAISLMMVASTLWAVRNQIEGRELVKENLEELFFFGVILFATVTTLLYDIKALKLKETSMYKKWWGLLFLTIITIIIGTSFKILWLGICLMLLLGFYALFLLYQSNR